MRNKVYLALLFALLVALPTAAQSNFVSSDSSPEAAAEAVKLFEGELQATNSPPHRFYIVTKLAPAAYSAGDMEKAKLYAHQAIFMANDFPRNWNFGNAIHVGNLVLGRIALKAGDITEAKRYLLESGKTIGSPQLNSFGPNMALALELLERGERDVVLEYFKLCANFWEMHNERLSSWAEAVKRGQKPNFRANLRYGIAFPLKSNQ